MNNYIYKLHGTILFMNQLKTAKILFKCFNNFLCFKYWIWSTHIHEKNIFCVKRITIILWLQFFYYIAFFIP